MTIFQWWGVADLVTASCLILFNICNIIENKMVNLKTVVGCYEKYIPYIFYFSIEQMNLITMFSFYLCIYISWGGNI